jgi:hypothetical protein
MVQGAVLIFNIFNVSTVITFRLCSVKMCDRMLVLWKVKLSENIKYSFF